MRGNHYVESAIRRKSVKTFNFILGKRGGGSAGSSPAMKPGQPGAGQGKGNFVICEICDGYIKDLEQLRNHMQWIHKVKNGLFINSDISNNFQ